MKSKVPILLYHNLESPEFPCEKSNPATRDTVVRATDFEAQIKYLADKGYKTISLQEYFNHKVKKRPFPPRSIIITFDDGHYSNYHLGFPILREHGFKAAFFVIADRVDRQHHLTRAQIKEMADNGMEIGSHGLTHKYLPQMDDREIQHELSESRRILETRTDKQVEYFAFPGGHYNRNVLMSLKSSGYKGACSCLQGFNDLETNPYLLKRIEVRKKLSLNQFEHIFHPTHLIFYQFVDLFKSLIRLCVGLDTYSQIRSHFYKYYIFKR